MASKLARKLRAMPQMQQALFIAMSGFGLSREEGSLKQAGFDHFLAKPPDLGELFRMLPVTESTHASDASFPFSLPRPY